MQIHGSSPPSFQNNPTSDIIQLNEIMSRLINELQHLGNKLDIEISYMSPNSFGGKGKNGHELSVGYDTSTNMFPYDLPIETEENEFLEESY